MQDRDLSDDPVSVAISVADAKAISAILSAASVRSRAADSVKIELRGSAQNIVSVLTGLGDMSQISASLSIRGT